MDEFDDSLKNLCNHCLKHWIYSTKNIKKRNVENMKIERRKEQIVKRKKNRIKRYYCRGIACNSS